MTPIKSILLVVLNSLIGTGIKTEVLPFRANSEARQSSAIVGVSIYRSTNQGETWSQISSQIFTGRGEMALLPNGTIVGVLIQLERRQARGSTARVG